MPMRRVVTAAEARAAMKKADPETRALLTEGERLACRAGVDFGDALAFLANNLPTKERARR